LFHPASSSLIRALSVFHPWLKRPACQQTRQGMASAD
jgi:hypothetical protein